MIKFLFLTIPSTCPNNDVDQLTYEQLKSPISFKQDIYGVTAWTMKHPLTIYSGDLKSRHVFKLNEVKVQAISNSMLEEKWRYFVITKKDGGKYYCTSQIIYQKAFLRTTTTNTNTSNNLRQSQFFTNQNNISYQPTITLTGEQYYMPRCIILISELPYFKLQVNLLKIHKELKKQQPAISHCIQEELYEMYMEYLETGREKEWESLNISEVKSKRRVYCPLEVSFAYYVDCCNSHDAGECIYIQKTTSREVLHLYKLYPSSLYQIGYFFHLPLSAGTLRQVISAILTEKQIVFSSSNANLTVMVIQTLMQMILPLKWCYMYAPNLPVQLIEAAQQSFMPYIVGISKQHLQLISKTNKLIVHIDTDEIQSFFQQQQQQLHLLSKKLQKLLQWKTNSNKQYLEWEKQLRVNSILLITTIFKKDLPLEKQMKKFQSEEEKVSQEKFYEEFLSKSMMYRKLIQDLHEKVYSEFYKLTKMDFMQRKNFLINKFNSLHSQTIYPTKSDNKKEWIRFYEKYMRYKRKSRMNRHSLSMVETGLTGVGSYPNLFGVPFYASNVGGGSGGNVSVEKSSNVNNNVNVNGNGNHVSNSLMGSRFETSVVTQYNSSLSGISNLPNNNPAPTHPPRTPSNITTTSNNKKQQNQASSSSIINKTQYFSNRQNQLYQSSVSPGSINAGLKFHLGQNKTPSKDGWMGGNVRMRKDSLSTRELHGMDAEVGRMSEDGERQQQQQQSSQQQQQSSLPSQQSSLQLQQHPVPSVQPQSQQFHTAPSTPNTAIHQNSIQPQIATTQFNPIMNTNNQDTASSRQYHNYMAGTSITAANSSISVNNNNSHAISNGININGQQLQASILYQSIISPVNNNLGKQGNNSFSNSNNVNSKNTNGNNNENNKNINNTNPNPNTNVNTNTNTTNNVINNTTTTTTATKANNNFISGLSRITNEEHQSLSSQSSGGTVSGGNINSFTVSTVGNQHHNNNNIYLQQNSNNNTINNYNNTSNYNTNYNHFGSHMMVQQHQQFLGINNSNNHINNFTNMTTYNNIPYNNNHPNSNNNNVTPYQYQPTYQINNAPNIMMGGMGNNFNGQISQIMSQPSYVNNSNNNNKHPQNTMIYNTTNNNNLNIHTLQSYPLNQSIVASYIFPNQSIPSSPMNNHSNFTNTTSHRNLPSTPSTAVL